MRGLASRERENGRRSNSPRLVARTRSAPGFCGGQRDLRDKLIEARARVALRMLMSPLFSRVTTAEIGRRDGFLSSTADVRLVPRALASVLGVAIRSDDPLPGLSARSVLGPVYRRFIEGFGTVDLKTAKHLLDELG